MKIEYGGSLEARRLNSGNVVFYWRHTERGKTERTPIGNYDSAAPPKALKPTTRGYSVAAALEAARELAKRNSEVPGGLRAEKQRAAAAAVAELQERDARVRYTLAALYAEYCNWLKSSGKPSWREAEIIFANHVQDPLPALAARPAGDVQKRDIVEALRKVTEAGKTATARKLRSYLRAAYACALRADSDATLPAAFITFNVVTNPVEGTTAIKGRPDKNPLTIQEMRRYWNVLKSEEGVVAAALRLHLLTGAQRVAQLARVENKHIKDGVLQLFDSKGKRTSPRPHLLPITKPVRNELARLAPSGFLLSTDAGTTPMHPTSLSAWASELAARAGIEDFQLKRVRSGVETELARLGIPLHIRGQLQSHGISGVQATHYDAHEYLDEKRNALDALYGALEATETKKVTQLRAKRA